jgi:crossover junction endodeoxyribonuclease RuvC
MLIISSDPGLTGAITLLCSQAGLLECEDIPTCSNGTSTGSMKRWVDTEALSTTLGLWSRRHSFATQSVHACIERPIPMPTLPAQTVASQFDTFGAIRALVGSKVPGLTIVNPREWKKPFGLKSDKDESIACALRLYPAAAKWIYRKRDHNRAESALIGRWLQMELA